MWLVVLGVLAVVLKLAGISFFAGLSWWWVLAPFALAAVWWQVADSTGITQRAAMRRTAEKAVKRRQAQMEALGLHSPGRHRGGALPKDVDTPGRDSR
jgi:small Trp-rich protein